METLIAQTPDYPFPVSVSLVIRVRVRARKPQTDDTSSLTHALPDAGWIVMYASFSRYLTAAVVAVAVPASTTKGG